MSKETVPIEQYNKLKSCADNFAFSAKAYIKKGIIDHSSALDKYEKEFPYLRSDEPPKDNQVDTTDYGVSG